MRNEPESRSRSLDTAALIWAILLGVSLLFLILRCARVPSLTDYSNWTYQGILLARHLRGLPDPAHVLKSYPVPNSASTLMIGALALILPWAWAAKIWLCAQLVISYLCIRALAHTLGHGGDAAIWIVVPQALFLNINFWYGFVNFQLGICWVLLMATMLLQRLDAPEREPSWPIGLLLGVAFFTHMIPFAFCGLLLILFAAQTSQWKLLWQSLPSAALTVWYFGARFFLAHDADGQAGMEASVRNYSAAFWAFKVNSYLKSFGFVNPGDRAPSLFGHWGYLGLFAVNALLAGVTAYALVRGARAAWTSRRPERFLWTGIAILLPLYLFAPGAMSGISDPGARLLQTGLALGLMLALHRAGPVGRLASTCGMVLSVAGLVLFVRFSLTRYPTVLPDLHAPAIVQFGHVPNNDQDHYFDDLDQGRFDDAVFPTGVLLNNAAAKRR